MTRRILTLTRYFFRSTLFSLTGLIYLILALVYWSVFFNPGQGTPDIENYMLVIGAFGAVASFLVTLTIATRANQATHFPLVVRLPSRVEYLAAVLLSSLLFALLLQLVVGGLSLFRGPELINGRFWEIPPLWIAMNVLSSMLAFHASDFVTVGWSRVYIYGFLALFLFGQNGTDRMAAWLAQQTNTFSYFLTRNGMVTLGPSLNDLANWLSNNGTGTLNRFFGFLFWPFRAIISAVIEGSFSQTQALAPAVLMLYATILFLLASDLFASKDLEFME